jgi:hypothetical protein
MTLAVTTTRADGSDYNPQKKSFTWSYSRLKNFETCPKRHWHIDVLPKDHPQKVTEPESEALQYGNLVHTIMAQYISRGTVMPPVHEPKLKPFADAVFTVKGKDVRGYGAKVEVEQKYAITRDFGPTGYFDKDVWFRGIGDVIWTLGPVAYIGDWKSGKIVEDSQQLALMAACMFAHHPQIQKVKAEFIWLKEEATTAAEIHRQDMPGIWNNLWPRIAALETAYSTTSYPAKPGGLCRRWCPVTQCPHNGT